MNVVWFPLYKECKVVKFGERESRMVVTKDCGKERMSTYCLICIASVEKDWKIMEMDSGDSCTTT